MFRSFLDGVATMLGLRAGEEAIRLVRREIARDGRARARTAREALEAELAELSRQLPGGTPASAVVVVSSSQVEPHAANLTCAACDGRMGLVHHRAATIDGLAVRVVDLECRSCGIPRVVHFRIDRSA